MTPGYCSAIPIIPARRARSRSRLLDCNAFAYATDDAIGLDVATHARIQMDDTPDAGRHGRHGLAAWSASIRSARSRFGPPWVSLEGHALRNRAAPTQPSGIVYMTVSY